ncbi:MAG: thioredoxin family protein [Ignavibacteria bacterium]|nr:thioredoxin family protein [Ignavibacteria bacterium]MBK9404360.1 thioredoxin family protein [Ignavibacteria bacterium]
METNISNINSKKKIIISSLVVLVIISIGVFSLRNTETQSKINSDKPSVTNSETKYKATFIELGSVRCIPCQKMQPVIKSVEEKYGDQVKVIFYDVWTSQGKEDAKQFDFDAIPTQLFLDENGREYFRHVGFFPEDELVKILKQKGVI